MTFIGIANDEIFNHTGPLLVWCSYILHLGKEGFGTVKSVPSMHIEEHTHVHISYTIDVCTISIQNTTVGS